MLPNARDTVRDRDAREVVAAGKRLILNARNAVRDHYAREIGAMQKRLIPNARNAIRNHNACHIFIGDAGDCFAVIAEYQFLFGSGFFQGFCAE